MTFSLRQTFAFGLILCCLAFSSKASAVYTSVKSSGMAGATAAHPQDALAGGYNPGGLGFVGDRWDLGAHWIHEEGKATFRNNETINATFDSHYRSEDMVIPEFAINACNTDGIFTWGFALYNRDFFRTRFQDANPLYGTSKLGLEYWHVVAGPTASVVICDDHCLGITMDLHGQRLRVKGLENFATPVYSIEPDDVTNEGYQYAGGIGGTIGWVSRISNCLSIGCAFSPKIKMSRFKEYRGLIADDGRINVPQRILAGFAFKTCPTLTVSFDVEHLAYNRIVPLKNKLDLEDELLGEYKGSGLGWMDQLVFRGGLDWAPCRGLNLRCGYIYQRSPVRGSQTFANVLVPNINSRIATAGGTLCFGCNEVSFYGAYAFRQKKKGDSGSIPDILGGGSVDLQEERWNVGLSWARRF